MKFVDIGAVGAESAVADVKMPPGLQYQDVKTPTPTHRSQSQKNDPSKSYPTPPSSSPADAQGQYDNNEEKQRQQKKEEEEEMENKVDPLVSLFTMIMTGTLPISSKKLDRLVL